MADLPTPGVYLCDGHLDGEPFKGRVLVRRVSTWHAEAQRMRRAGQDLGRTKFPRDAYCVVIVFLKDGRRQSDVLDVNNSGLPCTWAALNAKKLTPRDFVPKPLDVDPVPR